MWFWGALLGLFAGAALFEFTGALWGAVIGGVAGAVLAARSKSREPVSAPVEERLAQMQKSIEEISARLARLEQGAASPVVASAVQAESPTVSVDVAEEKIVSAAAPVVVPAVAELMAENTRAEQSMHADPVAIAEPAASGGKPTSSLPAAPPRKNSGPGFVERMLEGNLVAKLGIVILFFGVGFLLKYAYDRGIFPPEVRLLTVAAAAAAMYFIGRHLLTKRRTYALVMLGGAMGLLYLDVFFALKTFGLISAPLGFGLFAALGVATIVLAVRMDARVFAALGLTGAFLAPILAATGSGSHVLLFSYYLLLNLVILGASWFKSWRELNFIGFLFTFAIALMWGTSTYRPENFASVEPFLIIFFLLYLAIPILFASRQPPQLKGIVDATLVFGMPLSAAMLQAALTRDMGDYVLAWSALVAALVYAALAFTLWRREHMRLLAEAHLALAVVFGTVAPYFSFQGYPSFAFWTLEGAAIFWMGCRQQSWLARAFALCLQAGAAMYFLWVTRGLLSADPWLNDRVVGSMLIAAAALLTAWFMHRFAAEISIMESRLEGGVIGWGAGWMLFGIVLGAWAQWSDDVTRLAAMLTIMSIAFVIFEFVGSALHWSKLRLASRAHAPLIGVVALAWTMMPGASHPLAGAGLWAWPLVFAIYFFVLHRQRRAQLEAGDGWRYLLAWALMLLLASWEALWRYDAREFVWVFAIGAVGLIAAGLRFRLHELPTIVTAEVSPGSDPATPKKVMRASHVPLLWALVWWFAGMHGLVDTHIAAVHHLSAHLALVALSIMLFDVAGQMLGWSALRRAQWLLTAVMLIAAVDLLMHDVNPFREMQWLAWLLAFVVGDVVLLRQEKTRIAIAASAQHVLLFALALWLLASELVWSADSAGLSLSWQYAGVSIVMAFGLALAAWCIEHDRWPFAAHAKAFSTFAIVPLLVLALLWTLLTNAAADGTSTPLPFVPLLNPLDLAQLALFGGALLAVSVGQRLLNHDAAMSRILQFALAGAAFYWINAALLRTVHQWAGVPFELHALLRSLVAQAALSLLWTVTALVLMLAAGRHQSRSLWMLGAALLGLVVLKLFVNDIGTSGTERVVSFIGVGVLLVIIDYVAPLQARQVQSGAAAVEAKNNSTP